MMRSGSWYLVELLNEHPCIVSNGEVLNPEDTVWPGDNRTQLSDAQRLDLAYRRYFCRGEKQEIAAVGCKILAEQLNGPLREGTLDALAQVPGMKVLVLERRNQLEALRSLRQAEATGRRTAPADRGEPLLPPVVYLSPGECLQRFRAAEVFYQQIRSTFPAEQRLWMWYEDLTEDPVVCLETVYSFLGVPTAVSALDVLLRQEKRPLAATVSNFLQLREFFSATDYVRYFQ
jgi:hypothetical protein